MSNRKRFICAVLAVLCLAVFHGALSESGADPVVIRVGEYTYSRSLVRFTMRSLADQNGMLWEMMSTEERLALRDIAVNQVIGIGIIENKLAENGRHVFSSAEEEQIRAYAQTLYDQSWTSLYQYLTENGLNITEAEVSDWLDSRGYTQDMFYESALATERQFIMFDLFCDRFSPTDDEIDAYYLETYVEPDEKKYAEHIDLYEAEILNKGSEAFYVPEGYRYIRWFTVPYPKEIAEEAQEPALKVVLTDSAVVQASEILGKAATEVTDLNDLRPYRDAYDQAIADNQAAGEDLMDILRKALPEAEAVRERMDRHLTEGMQFSTAVSLYDQAQDYANPETPASLFHADSSAWSEAAKEAIAALREPGGLSEPVLTTDGMVIFYYEGDVPSGAHEMTEEERNLVSRNAVYAAQLRQLMELIETWKEDYMIETDLSLIDVN